MDKGYEGEYIFSEEEIESILEAERRRRGRDLSVDTVERVREILIERYSSDEIVRFNATELVEILITEIKVLPDFCLWCRFNVGEEKVFDLEPLLDAPAFIPLKDPAIFQDVKLDYGIPTWCDGRIDLSPAFIYVKGKRKIVEETKSKY